MTFNLLKAIRNTHRTKTNRILHVFGLLSYTFAITVIINFYTNGDISPFYSVFFFAVGICLFLLGHSIEGNLKATTWVILAKFINSKLKNKF